MTIRRLNAMALLTGLSLVLFVIEMQVPPPLPLPGVKIGLANVVTVYAVFRFRPGEALMILLARIFLAAVFAGQAASLLYSLAGGLLCLAGMLCLRRLFSLSRLWLCSLIGAVLHNTGQLAAAVLLLGTLRSRLFPRPRADRWHRRPVHRHPRSEYAPPLFVY